MPGDTGPTMTFVENSVLFFLFDKVDVMNHDDLVSLSASFYSETEIKEAKQTLNRLLEREGDSIQTRGDARKKNVSDILRLLTTTQSLPVKFCKTSTLRLPPVSLNHIDVAALMKNFMETRT